MKKSKLIDILSTFEKEDKKQFLDFIMSPFFNKKEELITFYKIIIKYYPEFPLHKVDRQYIYKKMYPNTDYNEKKLGYLMSYLSKLAEQYLAYQNYKSDDLMPEYHLISAFFERDLHKYFLQEHTKIQHSISQYEKKSSHYFLKNYLISEVALQYFNFQLQKKRKYDQSLQNVCDQLDLFYITTKLEYSCEMANRNQVLKADYQIHFTDTLQNEIESVHFTKEPLLQIYSYIFDMLQSEVTTEKIDLLRALIKKESKHFSNSETQKIYRYAINFCIQMLRKDKFEFLEQAYELYLDGIQQQIFYENDHLSPWVYTNVIRSGVALKKYEEIKKFIYEYNSSLPESFRENALHYNLAEIFYATKEFDEAIDHLNKVKFSDIQIHLGSREILAKIYFETDEEEALLSLIASFSIFLKRNKNMSNNIKRPFLNFCDLLNQIMRRNPKKILNVRKKIEETNPVTSRSWLLSACDKVIKEVGLS